MELIEFKTKAAKCSNNADIYELCLEYLKKQAQDEGQLIAANVLDIYSQLMN